jgi:lysozyme
MSEASISDNARRWLKAISFAEGTWANNKPKYNILFGGGTFNNEFTRHPDIVIHSPRYSSAAAGAYQFMPGTWAGVQQKLKLPDFSPRSQDLGALELIRQRGVNPDTDPINRETLAKLSPEWASFPTLEGVSYYGQPVKTADSIISFSYNGELPPQTSSTTSTREGGEQVEQTQKVGQSKEGSQPASILEALALLRREFGLSDNERSSTVPASQLPSSEETAGDIIKQEEASLGQLLQQMSADEKAESDARAREEAAQKDMLSEVARSKAAAALLAQQAMAAFKTPQSLI